MSANMRRQAADRAARDEAVRVVERWNAAIAAGRDIWWSPTIPWKPCLAGLQLELYPEPQAGRTERHPSSHAPACPIALRVSARALISTAVSIGFSASNFGRRCEPTDR